MKCACPTCGRRTVVDPDAGDFPTPCQRCGALLRKPAQPTTGLPIGRSLRPPEPVRVLRTEPGLLAAALSTRRAPGEIPPINTSEPEGQISAADRHRMETRKQALRRAQLRANFQALGALGAMGFVFAAILGIGALALGFRPFWTHPATPAALQDTASIAGK